MQSPITEESNDLSTTIDDVDTIEIVNILQNCDKEIFSGWKKYKSDSIFSPNIIQTISNLSKVISDIVSSDEKICIVISGCGTSGRISFLVSRFFQDRINRDNLKIRYIIAGGDLALFTPQEAPEDDPKKGKNCLLKATEGFNKVIFIGVTCGLSAPFVAGQLDYCLNNTDKFIPVLIGFNPINLARNSKIEDWDKTFLNVAERMAEYSQNGLAFVVNPIVGPEPITGSSRMKSGTATIILLYTILATALNENNINRETLIEKALKEAEKANALAYTQKSPIAKGINICGEALNREGRICYVGKELVGFMGLMDASECVPTFGADIYDIFGYVKNGYKFLNNVEGDLSFKADISLEYFIQFVAPKLTAYDVIVFLTPDKITVNSLNGCPAKKILITFSKDDLDINLLEFSVVINLPIGNFDNANSWTMQLVIKAVCNALSTGAHIMKGKVYKNRMIDVRVSNNKLFFRSLNLIKTFGKCNDEMAKECLLKAIYEVNSLNQEILSLPISSHIEKATAMGKVVPTAIIICLTNCSSEEAKSMLQETPMIRHAIRLLCNKR
ncbi:DgyrCDS2797 [Dimorphilus gyrociliatus]|uniref:DgyrCDS2797 n=1 Tax=Dimorphilus gyrociliatus TaxID=2664684 RepID=A0A7I8VBB9_9ANNE|nr:DgyrCDS2797 [Dimorphilus gyrociliatus]